MQPPQWWPSSPAAASRLLLVLCCALLAGVQCLQLLMLYHSEPVALTVSFTPRADIALPSITVCNSGYNPYNNFNLPDNESLGEFMWNRSGSLATQLLSCKPNCNVTEDIRYPGRSIDVPTGTWSSWIQEFMLCHSFMPNITWGELPPGPQAEFNILMNDSDPGNDSSMPTRFVYVVPRRRRRPLHSSHGVRDAEPDSPFRVMTGSPRFMYLSVSSHVHERPSLRRAPCNATVGYDYGTCVQNCFAARWAAVNTCSRPEMLLDFPELTECSFSRIQQELNITEHVFSCGCLPACRLERLSVIESTVTMDKPSLGNNLLLISVTMSQIPQQVAREHLSYHAVSLFSEMGGYISLLLGVSAVSVAELAVQGVAWCRRALRGEKQPRSRSRSRIVISTIYP